MSVLLMLTLLSVEAEAGKLADGFRGQSWGEVDLKSLVAPGSCHPSAEAAVGRVCQQDFGGASIEVAYMIEGGLFYGVFAVGSTFADCHGLFQVLEAGYGRGKPKIASMDSWGDDRFWFDGPVAASWNYNQFSNRCSFTVSHAEFYDRAKAPAADRAAEAARGL